MSEIIYHIQPQKMRIKKTRIQVLVEAAIRVAGGQRQLAEKIGVSRSAICQWLAGTLAPNHDHESAMLDIVDGGEQ